TRSKRDWSSDVCSSDLGRSNENILAMARHVAELGVPLWIRHVLVPGLTDDEDGLRRTDAFIASLPTVQRVEVLPYHTLGLFKWQIGRASCRERGYSTSG